MLWFIKTNKQVQAHMYTMYTYNKSSLMDASRQQQQNVINHTHITFILISRTARHAQSLLA